MIGAFGFASVSARPRDFPTPSRRISASNRAASERCRAASAARAFCSRRACSTWRLRSSSRSRAARAGSRSSAASSAVSRRPRSARVLESSALGSDRCCGRMRIAPGLSGSCSHAMPRSAHKRSIRGRSTGPRPSTMRTACSFRQRGHSWCRRRRASSAVWWCRSISSSTPARFRLPGIPPLPSVALLRPSCGGLPIVTQPAPELPRVLVRRRAVLGRVRRFGWWLVPGSWFLVVTRNRAVGWRRVAARPATVTACCGATSGISRGESRYVTEEEKRLQEAITHAADWKKWGPYLSERSWGTVREDYSPDGAAWDYFPHDQARSRAYRWVEDGLLGICDRRQYLCFAIALWNGNDPIIKERLFGLTGPQGNHGEDVKEYYYYLDSTPTHSYMKGLYKYPQAAYPYQWLIDEAARRTHDDPEFELMDTGVFNENRYFD